jgi:hypothetical protein
MAANDSFTFHFDSAGSFPYYCTPHWAGGMVGLIIVDPVGVEEYDFDVPGEVEMGMVYPNPFNGTAVISYSLKIPRRVQIRVLNAAGQEVRVLSDATMPVGRHNILWDGRDAQGDEVAAGAYYVQVSLGEEHTARKILLIK